MSEETKVQTKAPIKKKYRVKAQYDVEITRDGKPEIDTRNFDANKINKTHRGVKLIPGMVVDLTEDQLNNHGRRFFELVEDPEVEVDTAIAETKEQTDDEIALANELQDSSTT